MSAEETDALTHEVRESAKRHGAALVGIASVDRFDPMAPSNDQAPPGHHPRDFLPDARGVVSIATDADPICLRRRRKHRGRGENCPQRTKGPGGHETQARPLLN